MKRALEMLKLLLDDLEEISPADNLSSNMRIAHRILLAQAPLQISVIVLRIEMENEKKTVLDFCESSQYNSVECLAFIDELKRSIENLK